MARQANVRYVPLTATGGLHVTMYHELVNVRGRSKELGCRGHCSKATIAITTTTTTTTKREV